MRHQWRKKRGLPCIHGSHDYLNAGKMRGTLVKVVNQDLSHLLSSIKAPTLIFWGSKDMETPLYMARRLNSGITGSKLTIIKDAGHFCFIDKVNKFNTEVKEFLLS